jgi:hypothetical protein
VGLVTEPIQSVGDAAAMIRSATDSIAARPPRGLAPTLGVTWACFVLLRAVAAHLATHGPNPQFELFHEVEVRAWLVKHALNEAPSTPPYRRKLLRSWVNVGEETEALAVEMTALTDVLRPVLLNEANALAARGPGGDAAEHAELDFDALERAVLDHAVLGRDATDHPDPDLRALCVGASAAKQIGADLRRTRL